MKSRTRVLGVAMLTLVATGFAMSTGAGVALAVSNNHWTGGGDDTSWTDNSNWELGASPTVFNSNALLNPLPVSPVTIVIDGTAETAERMSVSGSSAGDVELIIRNGGSLVVNSPEPFGISDATGTGTVTVEPSASNSTFVKAGSFTLGNAGPTGIAVNDGTLNLGAGTFEGSHMNIGHFTGDVRGSGFVNLSGTGTLSALNEFNIATSVAHGQTSYVNFNGGGTIKVAPGLETITDIHILTGRIQANGATGVLGTDILKTTDGSSILYNLAVTGGVTGDFNGDGIVDGADYLEWQRTDGTSGGLSDWQGNYGSGAVAATSALSAVPEPASLALIALGLGGLGVMVRRRR